MIELNIPQKEFIDITEPFRGYVGGYRAGKTFVGCVRLWMMACLYPNIKLGYFAPTYPQIRDIFYPTIEEVGEKFSDHAGGHCSVEVLKAEHSVKLLINGEVRAVVKCRSMEHPDRIIGFDISHALIDEIDTMKIDKADLAWKRIIARMSSVRQDYTINTADFTTTPEGFNWMHKFFIKELADKPEMKPFYKLVKASTLKNRAHLPPDYIDKLYATYPSNLVDAYVHGEFVNLTSGSVYNQYSRNLNNTSRVWDGKEPVYIGMDFNVGQMAAVIHIKEDGKPIAVDEIVNAYDTPEMIDIIKSRFQGCTIRVYPDASGGSRKSVNASKTDLSLLEQAGFSVIANKKNPFVKDRILAMNRAFCDNNGNRDYLVNVDKCPTYADCLEQQVWAANGEPDKTQGKDHANDAGGYFIAYDYPIIKPVATMPIRFAI